MNNVKKAVLITALAISSYEAYAQTRQIDSINYNQNYSIDNMINANLNIDSISINQEHVKSGLYKLPNQNSVVIVAQYDLSAYPNRREAYMEAEFVAKEYAKKLNIHFNRFYNEKMLENIPISEYKGLVIIKVDRMGTNEEDKKIKNSITDIFSYDLK